jgi:hypothetical protein
VSQTISHKQENSTPLWQLWWAVFAYAAIVALLVQLVLLPYVFPAWHAGDGLMVEGDSPVYHQLAVELAQKIRTQGWFVWELQPVAGESGPQAPIGIASAIYALTVPHPWTLIPFNAALHATAAILLLRIIQVFLPNWRQAIWCVLPFVLYPSAMTWYTQIHKDGVFITGTFLFLYGWIALAQLKTWQSPWWQLFLATVWMLLGAVVVWVVRPYGVQLMQAVGIILAFGFTGVFVGRSLKAQLPWRKAITGIVVTWAVIALLSPLAQQGLKVEAPKVPKAPRTRRANVEVAWVVTKWLPRPLDQRLYSLARTRKDFLSGYREAGSNVDVDVRFRRASDLIVYMPRAIQIAFLAPFPRHWFESGSIPANTATRRITGLEMIGAYLALLFLPWAIWYWRRYIEIWVILFFCCSMILLYAIGVPNLGTLYRMRYGFWMTAIALGIAGYFIARKQLIQWRQSQYSQAR